MRGDGTKKDKLMSWLRELEQHQCDSGSDFESVAVNSFGASTGTKDWVERWMVIAAAMLR